MAATQGSRFGSKKMDYQVVLAGKYGVGKTSIFRAMFNKEFCKKKPPSAVECSTHYETFDDESQTISIGLKIWDTVDMEKHDSITGSYYRGSHFVLLVYSVDDKSSLEELEVIAKNARIYEPMAKFILVRNKTDLDTGPDGVTLARENVFLLRMKDGSGRQRKILANYSTSAKANEGIKHLLKELAQHALKLYKAGLQRPINYENDPFKEYIDLSKQPKSSYCCS